MISVKVLSSAAAIALVVSLAPSASFAQHPGKASFAARGGGAPAARFSGGGPRMGGGAPAARFAGARMGGGAAAAQFRGNGGGAVAQFHGGGGGGGYRGGGGGYRRGGGFIPGAVAGAVIGGALASDSYAYYGGPGYYAPGYDDGQYYDDGAVAVAPAPVGGDDVAYCAQTYRSYDPASGTYLGYDGLRHPCP